MAKQRFMVDRQVDPRGFRERVICTEDWRDEKYIQGRIVSVFAYHPCNEAEGRELANRGTMIAYDLAEVQFLED
jgi:hypothetical protein